MHWGEPLVRPVDLEPDPEPLVERTAILGNPGAEFSRKKEGSRYPLRQTEMTKFVFWVWKKKTLKPNRNLGSGNSS